MSKAVHVTIGSVNRGLTLMRATYIVIFVVVVVNERLIIILQSFIHGIGIIARMGINITAASINGIFISFWFNLYFLKGKNV